MLQQMASINKETEIIKETKQVPDLKTTVTERKNTLENFKSRVELAVNMYTHQSKLFFLKKEKKQRIKKNEHNLKGL